MIDLLINLAVFVGYAGGWFAGTIAGARWFATHKSCKRSYYCVHLMGCWRGDGVVGFREMWCAALPALIWPIALIPIAAVYVANKKPTPKAQAARIAELERELGIGDRR